MSTTAPNGSGTFVGPDDAPDLYQLIRQIGAGGEAEVWQATTRPDPQSVAGITVAVKVFNPAGDEREEGAWLARTKAMLHVRHPGLAQVLNVFLGGPMHGLGERAAVSDGRRWRFLVMEYVAGDSLQEWLEDNPAAAFRERYGLLTTVAAALDKLHSGSDGVPPTAHGDVKPDNIRLSGDGGIKLVDFGQMRLVGASTGPAMASRPYTAAEIFDPATGGAPTPATDCFSFAATTFQVMTGLVPPLRDDALGPDLDKMRQVLLSATLTHDRPELVTRIMDGLSADPDQRPTNLVQWLGLARATTSVAVGNAAAVTLPASPPHGVGTTASTNAAPQTKGTRSRRGALAVLIAGLLVVVAGGSAVAIALQHRDKPMSQVTDDSGRTSASAPTTATMTTPATTPDPSPTTSATETDTPTETASDVLGDGGDPSSETLPTAQSAAMGVTMSGDGADDFVIDSDAVETDVTGLEINGKKFESGFRAHEYFKDYSTAYVDLNLSRSYSKVTGRLGVTDDSTAGTSLKAQFIADGKVIYTKNVSLGHSYELSLPVTGVLRLRIQFTGDNVNVAGAVGDPMAMP